MPISDYANAFFLARRNRVTLSGPWTLLRNHSDAVRQPAGDIALADADYHFGFFSPRRQNANGCRLDKIQSKVEHDKGINPVQE